MAIFGPKAWVNSFGKCQFFDCLIFFFYSLERRFFVLEYLKRYFPGLYCLKRKNWKIAIFGPKRWVNHLWKCQFFDFLIFLFYSLEKRFLVLEYRKRHFPGLYCLEKKTFKKMAIFRPKPWVNPLEKCQFFDFLNFLFL